MQLTRSRACFSRWCKSDARILKYRATICLSTCATHKPLQQKRSFAARGVTNLVVHGQHREDRFFDSANVLWWPPFTVAEKVLPYAACSNRQTRQERIPKQLGAFTVIIPVLAHTHAHARWRYNAQRAQHAQETALTCIASLMTR